MYKRIELCHPGNILYHSDISLFNEIQDMQLRLGIREF